jgi:tetratricopeptide (TPR) repeat protein
MTNVNAAWELLKARHFDEAVAAYEKQLQEEPEKKWSNTAGLAEALMGAARYASAIPLFEKVNDYQRARLAVSAGCREQISVCHWMIGDRQNAIDIIRDLVVAVRDGRERSPGKPWLDDILAPTRDRSVSDRAHAGEGG